MDDTRDRVVDAFMALVAERGLERIAPADIAERSGVSLAELAARFPSRLHILDAFARKIDAEVLTLDASDMATEAPRERLFDVLMSRIDALRPYREAVGALVRAVRRDPALALAMNAFAVRSHAFMLAQAGIDASGWRGRVAAQGMAVVFARVVGVFVGEADAGLPRTMAALDGALREAERRYLRAARFTGPLVRNRRALAAPAYAPAQPAAPLKRAGDPWADLAAAAEADPSRDLGAPAGPVADSGPGEFDRPRPPVGETSGHGPGPLSDEDAARLLGADVASGAPASAATPSGAAGSPSPASPALPSDAADRAAPGDASSATPSPTPSDRSAS